MTKLEQVRKDKVTENVTRLMRVNRLSYRDVGANTDLQTAGIHRIATGGRGDVKLSSLVRLAEFFGVTVGQLIGEEDMDFEVVKFTPERYMEVRKYREPSTRRRGPRKQKGEDTHERSDLGTV